VTDLISTSFQYANSALRRTSAVLGRCIDRLNPRNYCCRSAPWFPMAGKAEMLSVDMCSWWPHNSDTSGASTSSIASSTRSSRRNGPSTYCGCGHITKNTTTPEPFHFWPFFPVDRSKAIPGSPARSGRQHAAGTALFGPRRRFAHCLPDRAFH
jgi:hypothetical protein